MKIIYQSYSELLLVARHAFRSLFFGLFRLVWSTILLAINLAVFGYKFLLKIVGRRPALTLTLFLAALLLSNLVNYASMKTQLNTARWQYDTLKFHTDSIFELYNITPGYSRLEASK